MNPSNKKTLHFAVVLCILVGSVPCHSVKSGEGRMLLQNQVTATSTCTAIATGNGSANCSTGTGEVDPEKIFSRFKSISAKIYREISKELPQKQVENTVGIVISKRGNTRQMEGAWKSAWRRIRSGYSQSSQCEVQERNSLAVTLVENFAKAMVAGVEKENELVSMATKNTMQNTLISGLGKIFEVATEDTCQGRNVKAGFVQEAKTVLQNAYRAAFADEATDDSRPTPRPTPRPTSRPTSAAVSITVGKSEKCSKSQFLCCLTSAIRKKTCDCRGRCNMVLERGLWKDRETGSECSCAGGVGRFGQ